MSLVGVDGWFPFSFVKRINLGTASSSAVADAAAVEESTEDVGQEAYAGGAGGDPFSELGLWKWNWQTEVWELCDFNGDPISSEFATASDPFSEEYEGCVPGTP